jgi:hypothetical protein
MNETDYKILDSNYDIYALLMKRERRGRERETQLVYGCLGNRQVDAKDEI